MIVIATTLGSESLALIAAVIAIVRFSTQMATIAIRAVAHQIPPVKRVTAAGALPPTLSAAHLRSAAVVCHATQRGPGMLATISWLQYCAGEEGAIRPAI
jgi:hypothetical protein